MAKFRGFDACSCLIAWLPEYEKALLRAKVIKHNIDIYQLIGGAAASGGTHSKGGAFDIAQTQATAIKIARQMGADATWHRQKNWDGRGGIAHTHGVLRGCPHNTPARYQITAVDDGYNGLGAGGRARKDDGPRPLSKRTWKEGIAWAKAQATPPAAKTTIRPLWYNIPGADKLPNAADRAKAGAALIKSGKPTVFGINEGVGPGKDSASNKPSTFAKSLLDALGPGYAAITPTTAFNENYIFYDTAKTALVKRYPDLKVYAKAGGKAVPGRHLTVAVLKDRATEEQFVYGVTHLVNGAEWGDGRAAQAVIIRDELDRISALHGKARIFIGGDMNRSDDLPAFSRSGMTNLRHKALTSTNAKYATYSNIKNRTMGTNPEWIIDHGYGPATWTVNGYTVLLGYVGGKFPTLRPSDHVPILFSVTSP